MIRAASLDETLEAAKRAMPPDCFLVIESSSRKTSAACAASYRRLSEFGNTLTMWYETGATEAEALTKLVRKCVGEGMAA